ncbi:MAG: hypothetical protein M1834_008162 [Cirrosporium novae-zelandiae]|nr:MAG: hypothetical protein M1834_008162 [Cirrosporium novae-zelandiae]
MKTVQASALYSLLSLVPTVLGHGFVTSPTPRQPGSAMESACGVQVYDNQAADSYGNIQGMLQVAASQSDYDAAACDIWLCKGYKYADNTDNVQSYTAGESVAITVDIRAPHTGVANVSIVNTATNTVIGDALKSWSVYASTASSIPADEEQFSVTIPSDLGDTCSTAGACVIQWYWNAASIDQTYESCIDFTVSGSGSSSSGSGASSAVSSAAAATSVAASSDVVASSAISSVSTQVAVAATSAIAYSSAVPTSAAVAASTFTTSAVTSSVVTSSAAAASATSTDLTSLGLNDTIPSGTTFEDMLVVLEKVVNKVLASSNGSTSSKLRRHARDMLIAASRA